MAAPYRSAQKLRKDNCLSELTSNATLKATTLANLGIAAEGAQLDNTFAIENSSDTTKKIAFSASGVTTANTVTLSPPVATGSSTLVGTAASQALSSKTITFAAGTTSVAPIVMTSGTNLTSATAGAIEYDGVSRFFTNEVTSGRGIVPVKQYFYLNSNGSTVSTIANFFGTTSNISLVSGGYYDIDIYAWFTNSADTNTMTWTLTNSAAPTSQNIYFEMSPAAGIVAPPGTATALVGQFVNDNTAAKAFNSGALGSGANYYARFKIWLKNGTGTSLQIQATKNTGGTVTPLVGSYWQATRLPAANVGAFAA